jgi:hypothetical protein
MEVTAASTLLSMIGATAETSASHNAHQYQDARIPNPAMAQRFGRVEPYLLPVLIVAVATAALTADALAQSLSTQLLLGLVGFAVLAVAIRSMSPYWRRMIWLLVLLCIPVELFGSVFWGAYRYRFMNVPLYVPPGHGLVYLFSLRIVISPLFERHARLLVWSALGIATAWMGAGLLYWPGHGGRLDVFGLICWPIFVLFTLRTSRATLFAAAFFATSALELLGTGLGDWRWASSTPVVHIATGNPPSVVAGLYCLLDALVLVSNRALLRLVRAYRLSRELTKARIPHVGEALQLVHPLVVADLAEEVGE